MTLRLNTEELLARIAAATAADTNISNLPPLSDNLQSLDCSDNPFILLRDPLPANLVYIFCNHKHLRFMGRRESITSYVNYVRTTLYKLCLNQYRDILRQAKNRCAIYKEELMAVAWHPRRVEKWLEAGGFELLDSL